MTNRTNPNGTLAFWFDFASTYSYVAAMRIEDLCARGGVALQWEPFMLGPIFALQGWNDSPFNINQRRGDYMWRDVERLCGKFGIAYRRPTVFPRVSTLPARVACANASEPWCGELIRRVFAANFAHDRDISDEAVVAAILKDLGLNASGIIAQAHDVKSKPLLRANTERAIKLGIFGAPNCVVGEELFWGEETLEDAVAFARRAETAS